MKPMQKPIWQPARARLLQAMGAAWQEAIPSLSHAEGCSGAGAGDEWVTLVLLIITKTFTPGEFWGELWVNRACMREIVLELAP